jgi:gamma-glutamyltranspeptidase/glutathione hydrolase
MRGAVASGHPLTTRAATETLRRGGNAFDAAVAAGFAASVAEPILTSLGGGGFLLGHAAPEDRDVLVDFFVTAPGLGAPAGARPVLIPIEVNFRFATQVFHVGAGSVAVPGMLRGLLHLHGRFCTMDIQDIVLPALRELERGVEVSDFQHYAIGLLAPILTYSDYGKQMYGEALRRRRLHNPLLREFLSHRDPDTWLAFFGGETAEAVARDMQKEGGLLTARDLREYQVKERKTLRAVYRGYEVHTNPPPSVGGPTVLAALGFLERKPYPSESPEEAIRRAEAMDLMNRLRGAAGGTTHVSIVDEQGNAASMSSSNGSNSGCFYADTGIMLNNMMGEEDLHPQGFYAVPAGERVDSMMAPTLIRTREGAVAAVLGSGGSKRIKTAMLQVILNLVDRGMDARRAVEAPRMHLEEDGVLHLEPGFPRPVLAALSRRFRCNQWKETDLYFGGVHAVTGKFTGCGDPRRGGHFESAA